MKRMLTRKPFSKMEGLTLLETMFALAVGALVLIGAVIFYMSTKQNANTSKAVTDMNAIVAAAESYMAGGSGITNLEGANAVEPLQTSGLLPNPINDPWGQEYTAVVAGDAASSTITITIPGIGAPGTPAVPAQGNPGDAGYVAGTPAVTGDQNCNAIQQAVSGSAKASGDGCAFEFKL